MIELQKKIDSQREATPNESDIRRQCVGASRKGRVMSKELTREVFIKALESFKQRVINLWDYSNKDSYTFPKLPELTAAENTRRDELLDHDAAQRATIQQLEARVKEVEAELKAWRNGNGGIVKPSLDSSPDSC